MRVYKHEPLWISAHKDRIWEWFPSPLPFEPASQTVKSGSFPKERATQGSTLLCSAVCLLIRFQPQHPSSRSRTPSLLCIDSDICHNLMYTPQQLRRLGSVVHTPHKPGHFHTGPPLKSWIQCDWSGDGGYTTRKMKYTGGSTRTPRGRRGPARMKTKRARECAGGLVDFHRKVPNVLLHTALQMRQFWFLDC